MEACVVAVLVFVVVPEILWICEIVNLFYLFIYKHECCCIFLLLVLGFMMNRKKKNMDYVKKKMNDGKRSWKTRAF